ncbi:hypothetical protein Sjap_010206 [Stephania japonica]|uniref:Transmembrane and coiled-coil domain-containing protein 4 n=1 Tax=Stephania japonica TaxID=461633 RepID=A0AAP0J8Z4_9MAGN
MMDMSILTPTQRYAAGGLFAIALHQAHTHQTRPLMSSSVDEEQLLSSGASTSGDSVSENPNLWVHHKSGLLHPVFRFLEIDSMAWLGLEETAGSAEAKQHLGAFLRLLSEENGETPLENMEQQLALSKTVDAMAMSMDTYVSSKAARERFNDYEDEYRARFSPRTRQSMTETAETSSASVSLPSVEAFPIKEDVCIDSDSKVHHWPVEEITLVNHHRKVAVLYGLLSACLANTNEGNKKHSRVRKGYDARHRVALRLLSAWLDVKWRQVEAMEVMVAYSAMALMKEEESKEDGTKSTDSKWLRWKRGGIIGAAALTGGALLAITGGLAAPAIAAGFGALAPTLGTLVPVIGAGGFAAVASAAGSVAGSVAVAASFGAAGAGLTGSKMARRIGSVDEFEFKALGENHNKGRLAVGILVSGFVFEVEDFVRPWEGEEDNLERYALQWESKHLIAVSTAIHDWLTSRVAMELMRQGAMMTVLSTLLLALGWPATLLAATDFIDSKWTIAVNRSDKAGKLLAEVLAKGLQGNRPVTLVGFSLGARVIFKCLQHLAEREENAGLVERVVLLGAPISIKDESWGKVRKIVAGRFVNAYSTSDWTLGVAFRASLLTKGLAGIQPIDTPGIENVDVTTLVDGHSSYLWTTHQVIERLELDCYYPVFM